MASLSSRWIGPKINIRIIVASSPQAKGRVERSHGTHQDQLIKKLRGKGIDSYEAANQSSGTRVFAGPQSPFCALTGPAGGLVRAEADGPGTSRDLCLETERTISNDWVDPPRRFYLQLQAGNRRFGPTKSKALACEWEDGAMEVYYRGERMAFTATSEPMQKPCPPPTPRPHGTLWKKNHPWPRGYKNIKPWVPKARIAEPLVGIRTSLRPKKQGFASVRIPTDNNNQHQPNKGTFINTSDLRIELAGTNVPWKAGMHVGSLYVDDPAESQVFDYLPESLMDRVRNVADFARVLVVDRWACNCDGGRRFSLVEESAHEVISQPLSTRAIVSMPANGASQTRHLRGVYARNCVYKDVTGWDSFEPALTRAEQINIDAIWQIAADIPEEWYESDHAGLNRLVETLYRRRGMIRDLIAVFRSPTRELFPNWTAN